MKIAVCSFVYDLENTLVLPFSETVESLFPKYPEHKFELVLIEDKFAPIGKKEKLALKDRRIIQSSAPRQGNLRSWAWIKEQIGMMAGLDADIVIKIDPDVLVRDLSKFLKPFEDGFEGMVGIASQRTSRVGIGACYAIHHKGLVRFGDEIDAIWNTGWMDMMLDYLREFVPSFGDFIPAQEDAVISTWFYHRQGLITLPSTNCSEYFWQARERFVSSDVVMLGNPGPQCTDKLERKRIIGMEFQKTIPIQVKKR